MSIGVKKVSTGVGGAGNIGSPKLRPTDMGENDFDTPTLKSNRYPTGRGGAGNMARNDKTNPAEARMAQDVNPVVIAEAVSKQTDTVSAGRGGAGNMVRETKTKTTNGDFVTTATDGPANLRGRSKPRQGSSSSMRDRASNVLEKIRSHSGGSTRRRGSEAGSVKSNLSNGSSMS